MTRSQGGAPFSLVLRSAWPALRGDVVAAVFVGGCIGGFGRYAATTAWPAPAGRFPWATLGVNVVGAFILSVVIVVAAELAPSRYLRPLLGTGFCGALTTFSSVVVTSSELFAHHHVRTALAYLSATIAGGLVAGLAGLVLARATAGRGRTEEKGSPQ